MQKCIALLFTIGASLLAQPAIQGISNAASFQQQFSPGCLVSIFGANLVGSSGPSGTTVSIGGKAAFVVAAGSNAQQLLVQLPVDLATGPVQLTVTVGGQTTTPAPLTIAAYAPAFFLGQGILGAFTGFNFIPISITNPATPGETIAGAAVGLGALTSPLATGAVATTTDKIAANPTLTVGGENAAIPYAGAAPNSYPGLYQVNFTIPNDASGCAINVILTVGGTSSPIVVVPIASPKPVVCSVENSATGLVRDAVHGAAANSFVSIYADATVSANSSGTIFPGTSYQGVEALYNGTPTPIYNVTNIPPSQILINTVIPSNAGSSGSGTFTVETSGGTSQTYTVALAPADVGVFRLPDPHNPAGIQGVALLANSYWFTMPAALAAEYNLPACTGLSLATPCGQPASPGDSIVIYFTGGGLATPNGDPNGIPVATGSVAPADGSVEYKTVQTPTLTIGGLPVTVGFSGIAPGTASEYQINTTIPTGVTPGDAVPVVVTFGNSSDTFTIAVKAQ